MQGSLIFVVIVAVWAAYLVQHWVRRREEAAEVRSVDGFSTAMRVLQKRPMLPTSDLATVRPASYTLTPARAGFDGVTSRSTVEVKRALPVGSSRAGSPLAARTGLAARSVRSEATATSDAMTRPEPAEVEPMPNTLAPERPTDALRPPPPSRRPSGPSTTQRRLRAAVLLLALLWVPVSIGLVVRGSLSWFSVPFAVLTVAAVLVWLRTEAASDRAVRSGRSALAGSNPVPLVDDTQAVHTHAYAGADATAPEAASVASPAPREVASFFDGQASPAASVPAPAAISTESTESAGTAAQAADPAASAAPAAPSAPGTWSPVPVPRPTYSMKAKAQPRLTESGIPADVFATPEFADEADELDERARFARRAVSG